MKNKCLFCQTKKIKQDILWNSKDFYVKVGVGILAPGHVMLIPKKHVRCLAELSAPLIRQFLSVKESIFNGLKANFSMPILYEHGIYGQSINHAHLHLLPEKSRYYNLEKIEDNLFRGLKRSRLESFAELKEIFKNEGSYFYLEVHGKKWVFHTKDKPEGKYIFRKEFARFTGMHGLANWQTMPEGEKEKNKEWVNLTKEKLEIEPKHLYTSTSPTSRK